MNIPHPKSRITNRISRTGFTMVELLVVVAIILLLAALLVPALSNAMENGRRSHCRTNLRTIGAAFFLYAGDHDGWMPLKYADRNRPIYTPQGELNDQYPFDRIVTNLAAKGYVDDPRLFWCPSDKWNGPDDSIPVKPATSFTPQPPEPPFLSRRNASYMYVAGYNLTTVPFNHSMAPLLADESNDWENGAATPGNMPDIGPNAAHGADFRNVLFLDGRVEGLEGEDVANAIFDHLDEFPDAVKKLQSVD